MAAPKGNHNGKGNKGAQFWGKDNREKAATLKGLAIDWMIKVMEGQDDKLKKEVVLRIATICIPQEIKHSGNEENQTPIPILNVYPNNSDKQNTESEQENQSGAGGDVSLKDSEHNNILDSAKPVG